MTFSLWQVVVLLIIVVLICMIPFFMYEQDAKDRDEELREELQNAFESTIGKDAQLMKDVDAVSVEKIKTRSATASEIDAVKKYVNKEAKEVIIKYEPVEPYEFILLPEDLYDFEDLETNIAIMAQTIYGEARDMSTYEMSLVAWCICNRVDSPQFPSTIEEVIKQKGQFHGYSADKPIEKRCYEVAKDVIIRWNMESQIIGNVGRTLPKDYLYFYGKDGHNKYRVKNDDPNGRWDFTDILPNPYE